MILRVALSLALLSGVVSQVWQVRFLNQGDLFLAQISNTARVPARSRPHCSLLCQSLPSCASFVWIPGSPGGICAWAPVVFNVTPPGSQSSSGLHYYVIQTQDGPASEHPLGFRQDEALGWVRWEQWVSGHSQAVSRCAGVSPNLTSLLTLPDNFSLPNLSIAELKTHEIYFFFVDGTSNISATTWTTKLGVRSYPGVSNSTLGQVEDRRCLGLDVSGPSVRLLRVPCSHPASAVCEYRPQVHSGTAELPSAATPVPLTYYSSTT